VIADAHAVLTEYVKRLKLSKRGAAHKRKRRMEEKKKPAFSSSSSQEGEATTSLQRAFLTIYPVNGSSRI